jgi:ribonuclease Z
MSISFQVLGRPRYDNALLVRVDRGQGISSLLFDCGERVLNRLQLSDIQAIEHLFFSHLHMDHVCGFDTFFRATYNRRDLPNRIWGPPGTSDAMQHRFQGYCWNLVARQRATWTVNDIHPDRVTRTRYALKEGFATAHPEGEGPRQPLILETEAYSVEAITLDHGTPSIGYVVREAPRWNVDTAKLNELGLLPGRWLKDLKDGTLVDGQEVGGRVWSPAELKDALVVRSEGDTLAYLTDFILYPETRDAVIDAIRGVDTLVCESQYLHDDLDLATDNHHMTSLGVGELARDAEVGQLVLFHLSRRYEVEGWKAMLTEARSVFPRAHFSEDWKFQ